MMKLEGWKDAWIIFKKDVCSDRFYLIWNVLFMLYFGGMFSAMLYSVVKFDDAFRPLADCLMLVFIPMIGFYFSRRSFSYLKEDSYTQMLWYYHTLPIPVRTIMKSRYIQLVVAILFNGILFFGAIVFIFWLGGLETSLSPVQYISFALTWIGYALFINGLYIHMEFLNRGRIYFWLSCVLMLSMVVVSVVITLFHGNLLKYTIDISARYALLSPLMWGSLLIGALGAYWMGIQTIRKLNKRDLI
ncbi:hypothetical protein M3201_23450 [Paenibacillus motobuensis]|uniref:hypothetical protein n=1 Tax=Paenibacillus TaxID=44249 RepID=UPI00203EC631|nr:MULTISPECIES: hypothetical protein [Paenibacillus]MCM3042616.1 hypothetical protein [Paenibacillus lutimineralis]MCM3649720.1 hypothetical protein [Paenibacillus motobuensis]